MRTSDHRFGDDFLAVAFDLLAELVAFAFDADDLLVEAFAFDDLLLAAFFATVFFVVLACEAVERFFTDALRACRTGGFQSTARSARNLAGIAIGPSA